MLYMLYPVKDQCVLRRSRISHLLPLISYSNDVKYASVIRALTLWVFMFYSPGRFRSISSMYPGKWTNRYVIH